MTKNQLEFGTFRFDEANECVWEGANLVQLRPKAFAILKYLIKRPRVLVTKQQLLDDVWADTFVTDAVLKDCIRQLREALRDDAKSPTYIETAHRRGYRFIAAVAELGEQPVPVRTRALFFSYADEGPEMKADIDALTHALRARNDASFRWNWATYPGETHDSTGIKGYYDGLRMIFAGWGPPRDTRTNLIKGSLDDVKAHYAKLGERLGFVLLPPEEIVNELGYQYLRTNNVAVALAAFRF